MKPTFTGGRLSELIEEALLNEARLLLGRDLDVARREQEDLVAHALHAAVERVREAAAEVDEALGELGVGALQIDDDGDVGLELVGDLLRVVEVLGDDQVDLDARRAGRLDGAHDLVEDGAAERRRGSSAKMSS